METQTLIPVELIDPWKVPGTDSSERWQRFESAIEGMPAPAAAFIKSIQPYNLTADVADLHFLYVLSRLENADKHRQLILLNHGVRDVTLVCSIGPHVEVRVCQESTSRFGWGGLDGRWSAG